MDKYKKYYGCILFLVVVIALCIYGVTTINEKIMNSQAAISELETKQQDFQRVESELNRVKKRISEIKDSIASASKKIYAPVDSGLEEDSLFFALYSDTLEMVRSNSVKIKSVQHENNPSGDPFVDNGKGAYFVCDINMELVSNYVNLGKLVQDIYQYPYYIKINEIRIKPYNKDRKILLTQMSLRLYARTEPEEELEEVSTDVIQ